MKAHLLIALTLFAGLSLVSCVSRSKEGEALKTLPAAAPTSATLAKDAAAGRALFLKNCAHCHGADAHGGEGPDLHNLDWTDEQIATRIRNGKKGQMTAFAKKLLAEDIGEVITYLRTLR